MLQNLIALIVTFLMALIWLRINDYAAHRGWISSSISRKIIHMGTGPIFVLCWLLFNDAFYARFLAALVPLAITFQFVLVGTGVIRDEAAVRAMSRSGDRREILRGPLYYGIVFIIITIVFWRATPTGIVALMLMCGGDGLAEIFGRSFGLRKLSWNAEKSWAGSLGMLLGGWIFAAFILVVYVSFGIFESPVVAYLPTLTVIAIAGTVIESLPLHNIDNITVTLTAVILGYFMF